MVVHPRIQGALAFLDEPLPLVNVSLADVMNYATTFTNFVTQITNTPTGTVASQLYRGRRQLRRLLGGGVGGAGTETMSGTANV